MQQRLYIGEEPYSGFLTAKPNIPPGEIWVFSQPNGRTIEVSRDDKDFRPPAAPLLSRHATTIYKFRRKSTYEKTGEYLGTGAFPTKITWSVTLEIRSAVLFMKSGQYEQDNFPEVDAAILAAVQPRVEAILTKQLQSQAQVITNPHKLEMPLLDRLLPERRFDTLVRNLSQLRELGLDAQIVALDIQCPNLQALHTEAAIRPQRALLAGQEQLIRAAIDGEILAHQRDANNEYVQSPAGYNEMVMPQIAPIANALIAQIGAADPDAARQIVDRAMNMLPTPPQGNPSANTWVSNANTSTDTTGRVQSGGPSPMQIPAASHARQQQLEQLYQKAEQEQWTIRPTLRQMKEKDVITIEIGDFMAGHMIELSVPQNYPQGKVRVNRVKNQGVRIDQSKVTDVVQSVTRNPYDLVTLVQALVDRL